MLGKYLDRINSRGLILASGSVGRAMICEKLGLQANIVVSGFPEDRSWKDFESPEEYAMFNARQKSASVVSEKVVISADTIIALDGEVFEKPVDRNDLVRMMRAFSGKSHLLITAVVVKGKIVQEAVEVTEMHVDELSEDAIQCIADSPEEWETHSGGYSIDHRFGATIFTKINGDYYNIIGLPANRLGKMLIAEHLEWEKNA